MFRIQRRRGLALVIVIVLVITGLEVKLNWSTASKHTNQPASTARVDPCSSNPLNCQKWQCTFDPVSDPCNPSGKPVKLVRTIPATIQAVICGLSVYTPDTVEVSTPISSFLATVQQAAHLTPDTAYTLAIQINTYSNGFNSIEDFKRYTLLHSTPTTDPYTLLHMTDTCGG